MGKTYVVVGAGFRGFCDSMQLLSKAGNKVYIIDRDPFFGGTSYSTSVNGFAVDKGVHMFDSIPVSLADVVTEIMGGKVQTIDFVSVSAFGGKLTDGFSLPNLECLEQATKEQIKKELLELAATGGSSSVATNLSEYLNYRYGKTAGKVFAEIFQKVYNINANDVQPDAISKTSLGRLKFLDDEQMTELKQSSPWLDSVLAARRKAIGKVDDLVSIYPNTGEAMRGWCERAAKWLETKGATLCLGETISSITSSGNKVIVKTDKQSIEADNVIWANDNTQPLAKALGFDFETKDYISGTPMLFATLITKAKHIKNFTYLQNFDRNSITYRSASAGIYSNQIDAEGNSFITSECPAAIDSDNWKNADKIHNDIFNECKSLEIIAQEAELVDYKVIRIPTTFKVAKIGYDDKIQEFSEAVQKHNQRVIFRNVKQFFRREVYLDSLNILDLVS